MKTTHLDNEINRLKWLKRKGDLSPIGENTLIEYEAIKQALSLADVVGRSEQLKAFADWLQSDTANLNYDFKDLVDEYLKSL